MRSLRSHRAYSVIELLISIGIISLLISILLPAIQAAREGARRAQCQSHLHQIGLALHSYHDAQLSLPCAVNVTTMPDGSTYFGLYSVHSRLLPFLEQSSLYNSINFQTGTWPIDTYKAGGTNLLLHLNDPNTTAYTTSLPVFLCPSDGRVLGDTGNNYRGNVGVGPSFGTWLETPDSGNGLFPENGTIRMADVLDGLSHTAAFGERLRGSGRTPLDPERDAFTRPGIANTADQIVMACRIAARPSNLSTGFVFHGQYWFWTGRERTLYNHAQTPNGHVPDCTYGGMTPAIDMATARSRHPGCVNVLFGDGSQRAVADTIDLQSWRALGTRSGGELAD